MLSSTFIDEFGYLNLKPEQSNIFFKLMEERYRQDPTIITTNLGYDEWPNFLGNRPMVEALLSRLRHQCHMCPSTDLRCAKRKAEKLDGPGPGRIRSPGAGSIPENAGHYGDRAPARTGCWRCNSINAAFR